MVRSYIFISNICFDVFFLNSWGTLLLAGLLHLCKSTQENFWGVLCLLVFLSRYSQFKVKQHKLSVLFSIIALIISLQLLRYLFHECIQLHHLRTPWSHRWQGGRAALINPRRRQRRKRSDCKPVLYGSCYRECECCGNGRLIRT